MGKRPYVPMSAATVSTRPGYGRAPTFFMLAEALERRRRKLAAGLPVEPPPRCPCCDGPAERGE